MERPATQALKQEASPVPVSHRLGRLRMLLSASSCCAPASPKSVRKQNIHLIISKYRSRHLLKAEVLKHLCNKFFQDKISVGLRTLLVAFLLAPTKYQTQET